MLQQLLMSTKQIPIITVGLRWNGHIEASFTCLFTEKFSVNHAIQIWKIFQLYTHVCHVWKWTIQLWNLSSGESRTRFKFSNIVSKAYYALLGGHGGVWGLRLTILPLFTQPYIIAPLPSNAKSFTWYDGFESQLCYGILTKKHLWRKIHLWDGCCV